MRKNYVRLTDAAINAYGAAAKQRDEPIEDNFIDLLTDLLHRYAANPAAVTGQEPPPADPTQWLAGLVETASGHFRREQALSSRPEGRNR